MTTSATQLTPSGARRLGDEYQDVVALDVLIDWLEHEDRYTWVKVEAGDAGSLDDVVMLKSDGGVIGRQVKYSNYPDKAGDPITWEYLLGRETLKSRSLLEKWAASLPKLDSIGAVSEASVVSNRSAAAEVAQAMAGSGGKSIDFDKIADDAVKQRIVDQLGSEAASRAFFIRFQFNLNEPSLQELEAGLWRRFQKLGGTDAGWHSLKQQLSGWAYRRYEPAPRGEIALADVKRAALWDQVTGALSLTPVSARPMADMPLIGRQDDVQWLGATSGDLVLVGAPGCGKTFLLCEYAKGDGHYFLVDYDRPRIITAIRALRPSAVIVDDAHLHTDTLADLRQIRTETGIGFDIVASCWPGGKVAVRQSLAVGEGQCRTLPLLVRDDIAEVVRAAGLLGPDPLIQEIVEQAQGGPGLAVTLTMLCLQGDVRKVALGDALSESIHTAFEPLVGEQATEVLAAFAIGGDTGMAMQTVAPLLGLSQPAVRRTVTDLAAGGVITEAGDGRLAVTPPVLRHAVVRDVFFAGPFSLPIDPYLTAAPDPWQVAETLIGVRRRGGNVPDSTLMTFLEGLKRNELWRMYAFLGGDECRHVLRSHPDLAAVISDAALEYVPDTVLPLLLDVAKNDRRPLNSSPDHPFRRIEDWIGSFAPGTIARRQTLVGAVSEWLAAGGEAPTGSRALAMALSPRLEGTAVRPGSGNQVVFSRALLGEQGLRDMSGVWRSVCEVVNGRREVDWDALVSAVEMWAYPQREGVSEKQPAIFSIMRGQAAGMVHDLSHLARGRPGVVERLREIATRLGLNEAPAGDSDYATLFPSDRLGDWLSTEQAQQEAVEAMADGWVSRTPEHVAARLSEYEREAASSGQRWPRWSPYLCETIAARVASPTEWAHAFIQEGARTDLVMEFVQRAVEVQEAGWEALLSTCLRSESLVAPTLCLILRMPEIPPALAEQAWPILDGHKAAVYTVCLRDEVSLATAAVLLGHESASVRTAAVIGVWSATPKGIIPDPLRDGWRTAILGSAPTDDRDRYWLGQILSADASLAREWIEARLAEDPDYYSVEVELRPAFDALGNEDRAYLLNHTRVGAGTDEMVEALVGRRAEAFRALLDIEDLRDYHLAPLAQVEIRPVEQPENIQFRHDVVWNEMTVMALDAGHGPAAVAGALLPRRWTWVGSQSSMWQGWIEGFGKIAGHEDERVREVSRIGIEIATANRDRALAEEHRRAVFGD